MTTQDKTYSVFISTKPYGSGDYDFAYLCSDATFDYNLNYSGTATGILGQGPDKTIFVDGSSGAVGSVSISGVRCNPSTSLKAKEYTEGEGDFITLSNAQFYNKMRDMLTANQMFQGAYILRLYNVDWSSVTAHSTFREMYIHIAKCDISYDWKSPSEPQVSLSGYRRNKTKGFGDA